MRCTRSTGTGLLEVTEHPVHAYYMRYGQRYVASFCNVEEAERFLDGGMEWGYLAEIGLESEPGKKYKDEGHGFCSADDCPRIVAARNAAFETHAEVALMLANEPEA